MVFTFSRRFERFWPLVWALAFLGALGFAAAWGGPYPFTSADRPPLLDRWLLGMNIVVERLFVAGWTPFIYIAGAIGLGRLAWPFVRLSREFFALQCGFGLALMLTYSHVLGQTGLFASKLGLVLAYAPLVLGLLMLIEQVMVRQWARRGEITFNLAPIVVVVPLAILLTAACNAPGVLWSSEFGGYDVLSYHLQLPQEWLRVGRIVPLQHNVYSFLPSYVEAAFMHLGVLRGASVADAASRGLLIQDGIPAISCQLFHAFVTLLSSWLLSRAVRSVLRRAGFQDRIATTCALVVGGIAFATPWVLVVGSLAYNEMVLIALFSSAFVVALEEDVRPANRAVFAAIMVGVACGAKPTALLFAGVPTAFLLLGLTPVRDWLRLLIPGAVVGALTLAPWMIRNYQAAHNPVFPAATAVFGSAHWSGEQVERFHDAHSFRGPLADRLKLLVLEDPNDPAGKRHRGMLHRQWGGFFILAAIALPVCAFGLRRRETPDARRLAWIIPAALLAQTGLWLYTTHLQSRFLLPLLLPASCVLAGAFAALAQLPPALRVRAPLGVAAMLMQVLFTLMTYRVERGGNPADQLLFPPAFFSGLVGLDEDVDAPARAAAIANHPVYYTNFRVLPRDGSVFLLGDTAPFYYLNALTREPVEVRYATTWDSNPLADDIARGLNTQGPAMVLLDRAMMDVWERSGVNDPRLSPSLLDAWRRERSDTVMDWSRIRFDLRRDVQLLRLR